MDTNENNKSFLVFLIRVHSCSFVASKVFAVPRYSNTPSTGTTRTSSGFQSNRQLSMILSSAITSGGFGELYFIGETSLARNFAFSAAQSFATTTT